MAMLEHAVTGTRHPLTVRTLVGRSRACQLRIDRPQVSGVHAELAWDGERWVAHDLGSRNGTVLDGRPLTADQRCPLQVGSRIAFGSENECYVLVDDSPPGVVAVGDDGTIRHAATGLLCLPSEDEPEVTLLEQRDGTWQLETEGDTRAIQDHEHLTVGGVGWDVYLPGVVQRTYEGIEAPLSLMGVTLEFDVSLDEEHVQMQVSQGRKTIALRPRAHDFFLLTLARARMADQGRVDIEAPEHGWVYRQDLARRLKVDRHRLNLWVYRARRQFADAGVVDVAGLIERRRGSEQLRLGVSRLQIQRGGALEH